MDIRHLRMFMKIIDHGSISAAADELRMSQPALSKHLSRLESEMQTELVERLPRGVKASPSGEIMLNYAKSIDANYRSALRQIDAAKNAEYSEISIGSGYYWLNGFLPHAIARLLSENPRVRVKVTSGVPDQLKENLLRGEIDLVFGPVAISEAHRNLIEVESLIRTDSKVMVRRGHPAGTGKDKSIRELHELDWVLPVGTFVRKLFDQTFEAHGMSAPLPKVEVNDVTCTLDLVANSDMATMVTSLAPLGTPWGSRFEQIKCSGLGGFRETGIMTRKEGVIPPLCETLCAIIRDLSKRHLHAVT